MIQLMNSAAGHALHNPYPENRAVSTNRQMISTTQVRTRDRKPETIPLEKAVMRTESKKAPPDHIRKHLFSLICTCLSGVDRASS